MTTIFFSKEYKKGNAIIKLERYQPKESHKQFFRYYLNGILMGDLLSSRPNTKRLLELYS